VDRLRPARADQGFTLVELLITVAVLGIIMVPLAGALGLGFRMVDQTSKVLVGSSDAQFVSIYLPADIKNAHAGTTSVTCIGTTLPKLRLTSNAHAAGGGLAAALVIVYWVQTVTATGQPTQYWLVRSVCTSGTATQSIVVARNLALSTSVTMTAITGGYRMAITQKVAPGTPAYTIKVSGRYRTGIPV
jgi:prepilin-type N-terminal cleavage/methylation domain-containing protein